MPISQDKVIKLSRVDLLGMVEKAEAEERTTKTVLDVTKEENERLHRTLSLQTEKIHNLTTQLELSQSELASTRSSELVALKVATDAAGLVKHHEGIVQGKDQMIEILKDLMRSIVGRLP